MRQLFYILNCMFNNSLRYYKKVNFKQCQSRSTLRYQMKLTELNGKPVADKINGKEPF